MNKTDHLFEKLARIETSSTQPIIVIGSYIWADGPDRGLASEQDVRMVKDRWPEVFVILGGPRISYAAGVFPAQHISVGGRFHP